MKFAEMYEKVKEGFKATRASWKEGEYLFLQGEYLVHNTPYFPKDPAIFNSNSLFYYVVEKDDPIAEDWEIL